MAFVGGVGITAPLLRGRLAAGPRRTHAARLLPRQPGLARSLAMQAGSPEEPPAVQVQVDPQPETEPRPVSSAARPSAPPGFEAPEPKTYYVRPDNMTNVVLGGLAAVARLGSGALISGYRVSRENGKFNERSASLPETRPKQPLQVFEFEACPFCRKVREALCILDLDVYVYPTPKDGVRFRPQVAELGGKSQFPYIVDPNTGYQGYESDDIIEYLSKTYGDGTIPISLTPGFVTNISSGLASIARGFKTGAKKAPKSIYPDIPLDMWGYETSPFCKIVREKLCELEIPYLLHNTARGSPNREKLADLVDGKFQVPYIEDPNTGVKMFESAEIVEYLEVTYGPNATGASADLPVELKGQIPTTVDVESA